MTKAMKKLMALALAVFMFISSTNTGTIIHAATEAYPNAVTMTVKDETGNPIKGATVELTIYSTSEEKTVSSTTDENGSIYVMDSTAYEEGMTISGKISKEHYMDETLENYEIQSSEEDITIELESAIISGIYVDPTREEYSTNGYPAFDVVGELEGDKITCTIDGGEVIEGIPTITEIGNYEILVTISRENYEDLTYTVTSIIAPAKIDGLGVNPYTGTYDKQSHEAVIVSGTVEGDKVEYSLDNGESWTEDINDIMITNAGTYEILVKVSRDNHETYIFESVTANITAAEQNLSFKNYEDKEETTVENGKTYDFSAEVTNTTNEITYSLENLVDSNEVATIDENGELTTKAAGVVKVTATVAGDANYASKTIEHTVIIKKTGEVVFKDGEVVFKDDSVDYIFGENNGIISNLTAYVTYDDDKGELTYSIKNADELGIKINQTTGEVEIKDYDKLGSKLTSDGNLEITVVVNKTEGTVTVGDGKKVIYDAAAAEYKINISIEETMDNSLITVNGTKGKIDGEETEWYTDTVTVSPKDSKNYQISTSFKDFRDSVDFKDQGKDDRYVYLKDKATGRISKPILVQVQIDTKKPDTNDMKIEFAYKEQSLIEIIQNFFGSNNKKVIITFTASDETSGIHHFDWKYERMDNVSESILDKYEGKLTVSNGDTSASIELPETEAKQMHGYISFTVTDNAGNTSDTKTDENTVLVIDTISPIMTFTHQRVNQSKPLYSTNDGVTYYSSDVQLTFEVTEANFNKDNITINLVKDGTPTEITNLNWVKQEGSDKYVATYDVSGDGHYYVEIKYVDESGNIMRDKDGKELNPYTSQVFVIDTIAPKFTGMTHVYADPTLDKVVKSDGEHYYYNNDVKLTFEIEERNFIIEDEEDKDLKVTLIKGTDEKDISADVTWVSKDPSRHVGTYVIKTQTGTDDDYTVKVEYKDKTENKMTDFKSDMITIDRVNPTMSVEYGKAVNTVDNEVDGISYGISYYNEAQTATIKIEERNFDVDGLAPIITVKDVNGVVLTEDYAFEKNWSTTDSIHTKKVNYNGNANYSFTGTYTDLAGNEVNYNQTDYFTIDTNKPTNLEVSYNEAVTETPEGAYRYYNDDENDETKNEVVVTLQAKSSISEIQYFEYSYKNADGVSTVNTVIAENKSIEVIDDNFNTDDRSIATATFTIPAQFNGNVSFKAINRAKNSDEHIESNRVIVDNINPTISVEYNQPVNSVDDISYYDGNIEGTIKITEANFDANDVIPVFTMNGQRVEVEVKWEDVSLDEHVGTFTLTEDGHYVVKVNYTDKSGNEMVTYESNQLTIDTVIETPTITINGSEGNGRAYKDTVIPAVSFTDENFADYEVTLTRTVLGQRNVNVNHIFVNGNITTNEKGGSGSFNGFTMVAENDGIYTLRVSMKDKAGHSSEKTITFTVNRFGSVYEYDEYLSTLTQEGGAYVTSIDKDLIITEYNADRLVGDSLIIEVTRDGKPLDEVKYTVSPVINQYVPIGVSGWYQYQYTIEKSNFEEDGIYKISISSKDETGNTPENANYEDKNILFRVDATKPEISSIVGLEEKIVNADQITVKYEVFDTIGLKSIKVFIDDKQVGQTIEEFNGDLNNYSGSFNIQGSNRSQKVRIVVEDLAGNIIDTDAEDFAPQYEFNSIVTVSTNFFVRWFANKPLFFGSIAGFAAAGYGIWTYLKNKKKEEI